MTHKIAEIKISYIPNKLGNGIKITNSESAYQIILDNWNKNTIELYEEFRVMLLNNANEVLGIHTLSYGGITGTLVDIRILYSILLKSCSTGFITFHNHPSGKLNPSQSDIDIYKKIKEASKLFDLNYLDNLIITRNGKYSFADEGY